MTKTRTISLTPQLIDRIRRVRGRSPHLKLNVSAICRQALEAECDRLEAEARAHRAAQRERQK